LWPPPSYKGAGGINVDHSIPIAFDPADLRASAQISLDLIDAAGIRPKVDCVTAMVHLFAGAARDMIDGLELVRRDDG